MENLFENKNIKATSKTTSESIFNIFFHILYYVIIIMVIKNLWTKDVENVKEKMNTYIIEYNTYAEEYNAWVVDCNQKIYKTSFSGGYMSEVKTIPISILDDNDLHKIEIKINRYDAERKIIVEQNSDICTKYNYYVEFVNSFR